MTCQRVSPRIFLFCRNLDSGNNFLYQGSLIKTSLDLFTCRNHFCRNSFFLLIVLLSFSFLSSHFSYSLDILNKWKNSIAFFLFLFYFVIIFYVFILLFFYFCYFYFCSVIVECNNPKSFPPEEDQEPPDPSHEQGALRSITRQVYIVQQQIADVERKLNVMHNYKTTAHVYANKVPFFSATYKFPFVSD